MEIYVRGKKDRKALEHVNRAFYRGALVVKSLGKKGKELAREVEELATKDFSIVLLGKEDEEWFDGDPSNYKLKVHFVRKRKVRNLKMKDMVKEIETAKLRFICDVAFTEDFYECDVRSNFLRNVPFGSDCFLIYQREYLKNLEAAGIKSAGALFSLHTPKRDVIFRGRERVGEVCREKKASWVAKAFEKASHDIEVDARKCFEKNFEHIAKKAKLTVELMREACSGREIVVPFSGGKDSSAILLLLKKARLDFCPVFVDTGIEFEETVEYVSYLAKKLGVKVEVVEAEVGKRYLQEGRTFLEKRLCTWCKVRAIHEFVKKNFEKPILLVGDRISESKKRSMEPEIREEKGFLVYSPIKYWSYFDIQLLFKHEGIELNKLYAKGFYRIGCKPCPFLDAFEKFILRGSL